MRSKRRRRKPADQAAKAEQARRRAAYLTRLTPEQMAAYLADREYVSYRADNKPVRYPRPPRSPGAVRQAR